jgi:hypothetical protein
LPVLGCGSGSVAPTRLLNASPAEASLEAFMNNNLFASNVLYGNASAYAQIVPGSPILTVAAQGASTGLLSQTLSLQSGTSYTVMVSGYTAAAILLTDNNTPPSAGNMNLRIINASPSLGTADVYAVAPGTNLKTVSPTVSALNFESASSYIPLAAGSYQIYFTRTGQTVVLIDSGTVSFGVGQIRTVVGLNGAVSGYTATVLADLN